MLRLVVDENFNAHIVWALIQRPVDIDLVWVREVGLAARDDPTILAWAARDGRIVLTHDGRTMPRFAWARVVAGQPMAGLIQVSDAVPTDRAVDELELLLTCTLESEWPNRVYYIPL